MTIPRREEPVTRSRVTGFSAVLAGRHGQHRHDADVGYWLIDLEVLHTTATEQLPAFTASLRTALESLGDEPAPKVSPDWTRTEPMAGPRH